MSLDRSNIEKESKPRRQSVLFKHTLKSLAFMHKHGVDEPVEKVEPIEEQEAELKAIKAARRHVPSHIIFSNQSCLSQARRE